MTDSPAPGTAQTPTKAIIAFVFSALTAFATALAVGTPNRPIEWLVMVVGVLVTAYGTYQVPNTLTSRRH